MDKEETSAKTRNFRGVKTTMGKTNSSNNAQYHTTKLEANLRKQWVRLITAFLYILSVSITAVVLAVYYGMYWTPDLNYMNTTGTKALGTV
ncbi:transmembrane protein INAFM2 [Mizuhopecten yessoensis]|uniref:Transmembrane protein INAFM2 n=1 Tax=Mizuhopecten yessoensis TaxID=6573 RepID=A0A210PIG2_MIZYE|nr:transmembrane protein INAFM2 [Mizuhopecten yessoensis]